MNIREEDNNLVYKERTQLERHLTRIIQRYFDLENNLQEQDIEEIIIESMTRLKRDILHINGYVLQVNGLTGHIHIGIHTIGGEEKFKKKTAFNVDFGIIGNTICEANDSRLYDARTPLKHYHNMSEIKDLEIQLDYAEDTHSHSNKFLLDKIRYTGSSNKIDLIKLESLYNFCNEKIVELRNFRASQQFLHEQATIELTNNVRLVTQYYNDMQQMKADNSNRQSNAMAYAASLIQEERNKLTLIRNSIVMPEDIDTYNQETYDKDIIYLGKEGRLDISDLQGEISVESMITNNIQTDLRHFFDHSVSIGRNDNDFWVWDETSHSFYSTINDNIYYNMRISNEAYQNYTLMTTMKSTSTDNDIISIVLTYDDATQSDLSLLITPGCFRSQDANGNMQIPASFDSHPVAIITKNFRPDEINLNSTLEGTTFACPIVFDNICTPLGTTASNWDDLDIGVRVIVKRINNIFKIYIRYNADYSDLSLSPSGQGIDIDGYPNIEINMEHYRDLSIFCNHPCKYGFGCFSQDNVFFLDNWFAPYSEYIPIGDAEGISILCSHSKKTVFFEKDAQIEYIRYFLEYETEYIDSNSEVNTETVRIPGPIMLSPETGILYTIQSSFIDNEISFDINAISALNEYVHDFWIYNKKKIILPIEYKLSYDRIKELLVQYPSLKLFTLTTSGEIEFLKSIITPNNIYCIDGQRQAPMWYNSENQQMFIDHVLLQDTNYFIPEDSLEGNALCISKAGLSTLTTYVDNERSFIVEYKIPQINKYFVNPRIYYQIYCCKR